MTHEQSRALVVLAAAIVDSNTVKLGLAIDGVLYAGVPAIAVDELLLQSVLTAGWPRALVAAAAWRQAVGAPASEAEDGGNYDQHPEWSERGAMTCAVIYGAQYERLRDNVRLLHPALDAWMVTEGYGRTLSRPGLALPLRELCTVVQTVVLRTPQQLHSHLLGALRAGAHQDDIAAALTVGRAYLSATEWDDVVTLWDRIQRNWKTAG